MQSYSRGTNRTGFFVGHGSVYGMLSGATQDFQCTMEHSVPRWDAPLRKIATSLTKAKQPLCGPRLSLTFRGSVNTKSKGNNKGGVDRKKIQMTKVWTSPLDAGCCLAVFPPVSMSFEDVMKIFGDALRPDTTGHFSHVW